MLYNLLFFYFDQFYPNFNLVFFFPFKQVHQVDPLYTTDYLTTQSIFKSSFSQEILVKRSYNVAYDNIVIKIIEQQ